MCIILNSFLGPPIKTTYRLLDSLDSLAVLLGFGPNLADVCHNLILKVLLVDQHENGHDQLSHKDHEQDRGVGHSHAVRFANGSAASEEGDQEDDASEDDESNGGSTGVLSVLPSIVEISGLGQNDGSNGHQSNAAQLKESEKSIELISILDR